MYEEPTFFNERDDQIWADLLAPDRRKLLFGGGVAAAALIGSGFSTPVGAQATPAAAPDPKPHARHEPGKSPWGYETYREPATRPVSVRPGEQTLPVNPRAYTDIKSYHAHVYFDEDTYEKAALLRKWSAERFHVELGNWNLEPRGPHVTPSFYFGFANEQLSIIAPWLQLNSLGLTILLHPNTDDPRADHLHYAMWVNRSQPVNAYGMVKPRAGEPAVEQLYPNTRPSVTLET